jgi:nitrous oxidase accessory protein NosD
MGFQLEFGDNHRLIGNLARNAFRGFTAVNASPTRGLQIIDNVAIGNNTGFSLISEEKLVVRRNVAIGNDVGFAINGSGHTLLENSAVGNRHYGIWIQHIADGPPVSVTRNNIFGNNTVPLEGHVNCGILNDTNAVVQATKNFWGAPTGPGADPADEACETAGGQIIHTPFAERQFPLSHKRSLSQSRTMEEVDQSDPVQ